MDFCWRTEHKLTIDQLSSLKLTREITSKVKLFKRWPLSCFVLTESAKTHIWFFRFLFFYSNLWVSPPRCGCGAFLVLILSKINVTNFPRIKPYNFLRNIWSFFGGIKQISEEKKLVMFQLHRDNLLLVLALNPNVIFSIWSDSSKLLFICQNCLLNVFCQKLTNLFLNIYNILKKGVSNSACMLQSYSCSFKSS